MLFYQNNNFFFNIGTSWYDCGVTFTNGWVHYGIELDFTVVPSTVKWNVRSIGDASLTQNSASKSTQSKLATTSVV